VLVVTEGEISSKGEAVEEAKGVGLVDVLYNLIAVPAGVAILAVITTEPAEHLLIFVEVGAAGGVYTKAFILIRFPSQPVILLKDETKNDVVVLIEGVVKVRAVAKIEVVVESEYQRIVLPLAPGVAESNTVPGSQVPAWTGTGRAGIGCTVTKLVTIATQFPPVIGCVKVTLMVFVPELDQETLNGPTELPLEGEESNPKSHV
jgi:hypothetical protein